MFPLRHYFVLVLSLPFTLSFKYDPTFDIEHEPEIGPKGMPFNKTTSCKEFGQYARFNPHSVADSRWIVFYYWATPKPLQIFDFWVPSKTNRDALHRLLDDHLPLTGFNWSANLLMMRDFIRNHTHLLMEKGDRGQYWSVFLEKDIPKGKLAHIRSVRLKQTGNNKYIGYMDCKKNTALIMSRINVVPRQRKLLDAAATLGYMGRKGKSYLYDGHEWMPAPEHDEAQIRMDLIHSYNITLQYDD